MGSNRWAHLLFIGAGLLLSFLMVKVTEWVWGFFDKPKDLYVNAIGISLGVIIALLMWRNKNTFEKARDITLELQKVTWPTRKETSAATVVVIITVIIAAAFLGLFDLIWSWASGLLYT